MNKNLCSFLLRGPKKFRQNDSHYLFQAFLDECEEACRESMIKDFVLDEVNTYT